MMVERYKSLLFSLIALVLLCTSGRGHAQNYWQGLYNCEAYNHTHAQHYDCSVYCRGYQYNAQPRGGPPQPIPPQCQSPQSDILAQNNQAPYFQLREDCNQILNGQDSRPKGQYGAAYDRQLKQWCQRQAVPTGGRPLNSKPAPSGNPFRQAGINATAINSILANDPEAKKGEFKVGKIDDVSGPGGGRSTIYVTISDVHGDNEYLGIHQLYPQSGYWFYASGTVRRGENGVDYFCIDALYNYNRNKSAKNLAVRLHDDHIAKRGDAKGCNAPSGNSAGKVNHRGIVEGESSCTNVATCCADLQRQYDQAIAPISRPPFVPSWEAQKQVLANAAPIEQQLEACRRQANGLPPLGPGGQPSASAPTYLSVPYCRMTRRC
jgi:hypothetical protein